MRARRWLTLSIAAILIALSGLALAVDGPLTNALNLRVRTDGNGYLLAANGTYSGADGPLTNFGNIRLRTDGNGYLLTTLSNTSPALFATGSAPAPSIAFAAEPTLGFWRSGSGVVTLQGAFTATGSITNGGDFIGASAGGIYPSSSTKSYVYAPANGVLNITLANISIGSQLKTDALPTVASGFGTSPAIIAGSTPLAGAINVGTGAPGTGGVINFNGTAFPSAPFVVCQDDSSLLLVRCTATTTQLTVTATALTASDIVSWVAISSK